MNREKNLVKNTFILTVGKICTQLISFFLLPVYTAILSTKEFGIVDLLNTLISLFIPIITFQIEQAIFRSLIDARNDEDITGQIISTGVISVCIQCILYVILFFTISPFIYNEYKFFLLTNVIAYIFASIFQQIARGLGDNKKYAISSFVSAITTILANIFFLIIMRSGAKGMLIGNMLGQVICCLYLIFSLRIFKYISFKGFKRKLLKKLLKYSLPLVPSIISWWIFNASDRIIVSAFLGVSQNGILSAAHKFSGVYITVFNFFYMSWTESVSICINDKDIETFFNKTFNTALKLFIAIGIGIISCMPFVYSIMIDDKFMDGYNQVPLMVIGSIFNIVVSMISVIYLANKNTKVVANTAIISATINIFVHLLLINSIGLYAATLSTLIAYLIMSIYRMYDIRKRYFKVWVEKDVIIMTIIILTLILPIYYFKKTLLCLIGFILTVIYACYLNKSTIYEIINFLKQKLNFQKENIIEK